MCGQQRHHAYRHRHEDVTFVHTPPAREPHWASRPDMRASDAEREEVAVALRDHGVAGRLGVEELDERLEHAYAARSRGDLVALLRDLPAAPLRRPAPARPRQTDLSDAVRTYLLINLLLVAIWLAAGGGYFWPVWVILGWGIALVPGLLAATSRRGRRRSTLTSW
jgi:hypothetical protein